VIGKSIAHYTVTDKIGEGGMGEVYKATDSKLQREVALKVLPDSFAKDIERLARFGREAEVLASLNHPNIAIIHGFEEAEGSRALVMELVDGDTLEDIIQRRGAMPLDEAVKIASQIALALEEAHEHGVVHRDLKPANVKVTPSGLVKVLDFGLAKALEDSPAGADLSHSPTISLAATQAGIIIGTAGYMSPEQASGRPADRRADVWSFGVLFYEMLTGRRAFAGETVSHTLAAVLHGEPDLDELPAELPSRIRRLLERCLTKDPRVRLQSIGEARVLLEQFIVNPASFEDAAPAEAPITRRAAILPWAVAGALAVALAATLFVLRPPPPEPPSPSVRLKVEMGESPVFLGSGASIALAPGSRHIAYVLGAGQESTIWVRALNQLVGTQLPGTEGGYNPFFSHDGDWIGFATTTELQKVSVTGGTPLTLTKVSRSRGADWSDDDRIILAPDPSAGLAVVPGAGGDPRTVTELGEDRSHRWPSWLPGSTAAIYTAVDNNGDLRIDAVDLTTGAQKTVHPSGAFARYAASGHLLYLNDGTLFAVPFDLEELEIEGTPAPVMQGIHGDIGTGGAHYAVSDTGTLTYLQGTAGTQQHSLLWVDHLGRTTSIAEQPQTFAEPRLSPDGKRLAVEIIASNGADAWVYDLERGASTRLTFDEGYDEVPIWSPDGTFVAFSSDRDGTPNIYRKRSDGSGEVERLTESENAQYPSSWSPDGRYLLFTSIGGPGANDIWVLDLESGETSEYLGTPFSEAEASFSPDGRWVAYQSDEAGNYDVFVRPFPDGGGKWQISIGGGNYARWSPEGDRIFYRTPQGAASVAVDTGGGALRAETPELLFSGTFAPLTVGGNFYADWDVAADGQRFIMFQLEGGDTTRDHLVFVLDWFDELRSTFASRQ
jgi:serine/threonine-protein kinase